ncbi:succinate dehydrogenase [Pusillimonas sp. TS35]|uniref:succinate dehydrogenase n=1 Tax=Paracandidimonas lactea TaxID=2895524 RepID=UPI0013702C42|nr:succinate dehydrogenase [Paracandidimonas lactea]MYN12357.1 succinate dehydrogenase [Pusillimonas sp. TS35]
MIDALHAAVRSAQRWYWQRVTAMVMALFVAIHLAVMIYAINGGLSAAEVLGRTRGSVLWAGFYGIFVLLVAVHASIGIRNILVEATAMKDAIAGALAHAVALLLLGMGLRAVWAVTFGAA